MTDHTMEEKRNHAVLVGLHASSLSQEENASDATLEELEALRRESDYKTAKERALRLLSARGYTAHQLKEKLSRYADEEASQAAVDRMEEIRDYLRD